MRSCTSASLDLSTEEEAAVPATELVAGPPGGGRDDCGCEWGGVLGRTALLLNAPAAAAAFEAWTEFGAKGLPPPELALVAFALEG